MRVTVNYQLKKQKARSDGKCPVYVRCTMNGNRFELSTGIFLSNNSWDNLKQQVAGRSEESRIFNNRLEKISSNIHDHYNQLESKGGPFTILDLKTKLLGVNKDKGLLEVFEMVMQNVKARLGNQYANGTYKHYKTSYKRLTEFVRGKYGRDDISVSMVDYNFINSFDVYLKSKYGIKPNTAVTYHKHLKVVLNTAISMNLISQSPYASFKVARNKTHRDYLTLQEIEQIRNKNISIPRLDIIRDIFVFACYTGLAYSDVAKLKQGHIHKGDDGGKWIIIDRSKTKSRCRVPLLPQAKDILLKYQDYPINNYKGTLLPVMTNQRMNSYLKELADICGINKNLSTHVARHTFATSVTLKNGVPIETVSKMLGHNSLRTTQIYAKILDSKISEDMKKLSKKIR